MNILLVEDEEKIAAFIKQILEGENFHVTVCESVEDVLEKGHEDQHDLVILDLMFGGKPGEYLLQQMRKARSNIPVLVLSALGQISKKIEMLNLGADDYLTKPFDAQELIARINALYRRYLESEPADQKKYGDLIFARKQNKIMRGKKEEFLTKKEGDVLDMLIQHRGHAVRTEDILLKVWQAKRGYHSNIVQATIRRLRKKIDSGFTHKLIRNIHGIGYMIVLPAKKAEQVE
ncbi:MAG TPA: response regulator transcription factor [Candidatus Gracilibacteria bacterium]|nr:response regulator transcription factor [Candidatus Gracilibacteria bacterium]